MGREEILQGFLDHDKKNSVWPLTRLELQGIICHVFSRPGQNRNANGRAPDELAAFDRIIGSRCESLVQGLRGRFEQIVGERMRFANKDQVLNVLDELQDFRQIIERHHYIDDDRVTDCLREIDVMSYFLEDMIGTGNGHLPRPMIFANVTLGSRNGQRHYVRRHVLA